MCQSCWGGGRCERLSTYNSRISTSVSPSGSPVVGFCLASSSMFARAATPKSYALFICGLILGSDGSAFTNPIPSTAALTATCLKEGIFLLFVLERSRECILDNCKMCTFNKTSLIKLLHNQCRKIKVISISWR